MEDKAKLNRERKEASSTRLQRIGFTILVLWFAAVGVVIAYLLFKQGRVWALALAAVVSGCLLVLDRIAPLDFHGLRPAWLQKHADQLSILLIALLISATSLPSLHGYFQGDDFAYLHYFHVLSWSNVAKLFHTDLARLLWGAPGDELRPMYGLFFMLNYKLWGLRAAGYHAAGLLLHLANGVLVYFIALELTPREAWRGLLAASLFVVAPLNATFLPWITAAPAELMPGFFYLLGFFAFMRYRRLRKNRDGVLCLLAFVGCLLSKEAAVTLPLILLGYDGLRMLDGSARGDESCQTSARGWRERVGWVYPGCGFLLAAYLVWRRIVLGSFLKEGVWKNVWAGNWIDHGHHSVAHFSALPTFFAGMQVMHLQYLFISFPAKAAAVVAGIYVFWVIAFLLTPDRNPSSAARTLYFGVFWYIVMNVPLLAADPAAYHMYLPAAGVSIATVFVIFPDVNGGSGSRRAVRLATVGVLIALSAGQLRRVNASEPGIGKLYEEQNHTLVAALQSLPPSSLAVIWPAEKMPFLREVYPRPLQPPFSPVDLAAPQNIIADIPIYAADFAWWDDTRPILERHLADSAVPQIELVLLTWDEQINSLRISSRAYPKQLVRLRLIQALGGKPLETPELSRAEMENLMQRLVQMAEQGN
jgi:hypothetical protein